MAVTLEIVLLVAVILLSGLGLVMSAVTLSGTWVLVAAAGLAWWLSPDGFPGLWGVLSFVILSAGAEVVEALAGAWGVKRRGGSTAAAWAAMGGGIAGMILGAAIPIPVVGSIVGMFAGSFGCAFWVEQRRLQRNDKAAHIAMGTVVAKIIVMMVKGFATLGMAVYLIWGLIARIGGEG